MVDVRISAALGQINCAVYSPLYNTGSHRVFKWPSEQWLWHIKNQHILSIQASNFVWLFWLSSSWKLASGKATLTLNWSSFLLHVACDVRGRLDISCRGIVSHCLWHKHIVAVVIGWRYLEVFEYTKLSEVHNSYSMCIYTLVVFVDHFS